MIAMILSQLAQQAFITRHQSFFLRARPSLDLMFTLKCIRNPCKGFGIDQFNWEPLLGIDCPLAILMLSEPPIDIHGASTVVATIRALQDIEDRSIHFLSNTLNEIYSVIMRTAPLKTQPHLQLHLTPVIRLDL
jgi:hypothetical protein